MIFFFNQKHMLDIFFGICSTPPSKIKWSTPYLYYVHQCIRQLADKKTASLFSQTFSRFSPGITFVGGSFVLLFALPGQIYRRSLHVPFQGSPSQSNMSAYGIVIENGCYGMKKGSQFQPLSNCTFRFLTPVLAGPMSGYLARAVHKDGNAK
jgi:hypothetical protein